MAGSHSPRVCLEGAACREVGVGGSSPEQRHVICSNPTCSTETAAVCRWRRAYAPSAPAQVGTQHPPVKGDIRIYARRHDHGAGAQRAHLRVGRAGLGLNRATEQSTQAWTAAGNQCRDLTSTVSWVAERHGHMRCSKLHEQEAGCSHKPDKSGGCQAGSLGPAWRHKRTAIDRSACPHQ